MNASFVFDVSNVKSTLISDHQTFERWDATKDVNESLEGDPPSPLPKPCYFGPAPLPSHTNKGTLDAVYLEPRQNLLCATVSQSENPAVMGTGLTAEMLSGILDRAIGAMEKRLEARMDSDSKRLHAMDQRLAALAEKLMPEMDATVNTLSNSLILVLCHDPCTTLMMKMMKTVLIMINKYRSDSRDDLAHRKAEICC